jgi:hypothetical protein
MAAEARAFPPQARAPPHGGNNARDALSARAEEEADDEAWRCVLSSSARPREFHSGPARRRGLPAPLSSHLPPSDSQFSRQDPDQHRPPALTFQSTSASAPTPGADERRPTHFRDSGGSPAPRRAASRQRGVASGGAASGSEHRGRSGGPELRGGPCGPLRWESSSVSCGDHRPGQTKPPAGR